MILKEDSSEQKLRGAYYTPLKLAEKMVELCDFGRNDLKILEPSCGDGVFIDAIWDKKLISKKGSLAAIEIEKDEMDKAARRVKNKKNIHFYNILTLHFVLGRLTRRECAQGLPIKLLFPCWIQFFRMKYILFHPNGYGR